MSVPGHVNLAPLPDVREHDGSVREGRDDPGLSRGRMTTDQTDDAGRRPDPEEAELLGRIRKDDLDAFGAFFERYRGPIFATAYALLGERQAAEEVLQDTFAKAYEWRRRLHPDASPLPWLHRVALNFCYTRLARRRAPWEPITEAMAHFLFDHAAEPADRAELAELREIVRDGIAALPAKHQAVIVLFYLRGRSISETADILGVPAGTVKSRLHFGLRSLRGRLEQDRRFGGAYGPLPRVEAAIVPEPEREP